MLRTLIGISKGLARGGWRPVEERPLPSPRRSHPAGFDIVEPIVRLPGLTEPLTVLQISDVHVRRPSRRLRQAADALQQLDADLVLLTGDIVAKEWQTPVVHDFLARVPTARLGRWACIGNWEIWAGLEEPRWRQLLEVHGIELLVNRWQRVGPLSLGAVDDPIAGQPDIDAAVGPGPSLVMCHCPGLWPELAGRADLVLSGHTHGGQVRVGGRALWAPRGSGAWLHGLHRRDGSWLHVSAGLGWSIAPLRLGCNPEIALIRLEPE